MSSIGRSSMRPERRLERGGKALALFFVLASLLHFFGGRVADPDLWQHVRYGRLICTDGVFPSADDASYTAAGAPLVNHEWLSQCVLARAWDAGGAPLLYALKLLVGALALAALRDTAGTIETEILPGARIPPLVMAIGLVLTMAVMSPGMMFRPQLATILLLAVQGALLARADLRLRRPAGGPPRVGWELAVQPLLLLAWANAHGGFLVGLFQVACWAGAVLLRCIAPVSPRTSDERPTRAEAAIAAGCAAACAAVTAVNPDGAGLHAFLLRTLGLHGEISEWEPVEILSSHFLRFKLLVLAATVSLALLWRARDRAPGARMVADWRTPLLLVAALAAFRHQRHTVLFAVLACPLVIATAEWVRLRLGRIAPATLPTRGVVLAVAAGLAAISSLQVAGWVRTLARDGLAIRYDRGEFPVDAMAFLRHAGISGNVAVPFEWGSFAIWHLPGSKVFIDGRFETVYPDDVIRDYFAFRNGEHGWERLLDAWPTDVVVARRSTGVQVRLFERPDLEYVYSDPAALVFVRRSPKMAPFLERLRQVDRMAFDRPEATFP